MKHIFAPWRMKFIKEAKGGLKECFFCQYLKESKEQDRKNLVLFRGEKVFLLLNRYPYNHGHLMVAPLRHLGDYTQLTKEESLELMQLSQKVVAALSKVLQAHGFNLGFNLGHAAGAGVADHLHLHILPRWTGDTNFMPAIAKTKVIPQSLLETYDNLLELFDK